MDKKTKIIAAVAILAIVALVAIKASKKQSPQSPMAGEESATGENQKTMNVKMEAVGDSKVTGTAEIKAESDKTRVKINLEGLAKDTVVPTHIQSGTCENPGWIKYVLNFPGSDKPDTVLDVYYDEMMKSLPLVVVVKDSTKKDSKVISCGELK